MIEVNLKNHWFGPDGGLYKTTRNPHSFPSDWKSKLPKSAVVVGDKEESDDGKAAPAKK